MREFPHEYKKLNTKFLYVDDIYQRELDLHRVNKIVREFNPNLVNPIKVSYRDGKYWVFEGHHTMAAQKRRNKNQDLMVECKVFYEMTWLDEVQLFLAQNGESRAVHINDKMRAMFNSGDPSVTKMVKLAEKAGFIIDFKGSKGPNKIVALSTLTKAFCNMTEQEYFDYLMLIKKTWKGSAESLSREILQGMYLVCTTYKNLIVPDIFVKRLSKVSPIAIIRDGKVSSAPGASKYARQIVGYYNYHAKDRLPDLL